jgi:hypothetical protein
VGGLALTRVGLLLTGLVTDSDRFDLEGVQTWIVTTLIVWAGTVIYDQVDDRLIDSLRREHSPDAA